MRKACSVAVLIAATLGLAIGTAYAFKEFPTIGGNGGGENRDRCGTGQYLIGVSIKSGSWVDRIAIICATVFAPDFAHRNVYTSSKLFGGNGGGGPTDKKCKGGYVIQSLGVVTTDRGARLVRQMDFGCAGPNNEHYLLEAGNSSGKFPDDANRQTCPKGEAAVGLHVRYGAYLDAVGLICDRLPGTTTTDNKPTPTPTPTPGSTLGQEIVKYAQSQFNKCVDRDLKERNEACPPLGRGEVGHGECTDLARGALDFVKARYPGGYVWGKEIAKSPLSSFSAIQPGDIIQMFNTEFWSDPNDKNKGWTSTSSQHTAIIESNNNGVLTVLEQNTWDGDTNRRFVTRGTVNLAGLKRGNYFIYRAEKQAGFIATRSRVIRPVATTTSGHRSIFRATSTTTAPVTPGPQQRVKNCPCQPGFTHRLADARDYVCVPVAVRRLIISETANKVRNQVSATDIRCKSGFVWRDAFDGDGVCVVPQVRDRVHLENRQHLSRVAPGCR